jgi:hypothetical protein
MTSYVLIPLISSIIRFLHNIYMSDSATTLFNTITVFDPILDLVPLETCIGVVPLGEVPVDPPPATLVVSDTGVLSPDKPGMIGLVGTAVAPMTVSDVPELKAVVPPVMIVSPGAGASDAVSSPDITTAGALSIIVGANTGETPTPEATANARVSNGLNKNNLKSENVL